ncbi:MAG TPA: DUF5723 family protein [Bacteroidia bacterium]|nr:DUF5723 family protein [Bacteroidia bacterium]
MRKQIAFCLSFLPAVIFAQTNNPFFELQPDSSFKWTAGTYANYAVGSTAMTNEFINSFWTGKFIDENQKQRVQSRLKNSNTIGGDANAGLFYIQGIDSLFQHKKLAWFVAIKERAHANARFSRDLFNVAFEGNDSYKGKTADFSGFELNEIQYQQFQGGVMSDRFGIGISVYNGQQMSLLKAKTASLYTSQYGDYLDFNTSYSMILSDPRHTGLGSSNGIGSGLDLYARMPMTLHNGHKADLIVELSDLGFIRWNAGTNHYKNDTTYHFDGFVVKNAFQLADTSMHYSAKAALNAKPDQKGAYATYVPATLDVKFAPLGVRFQYLLGIRYRFDSDYRAYGYGQIHYHFGPRFILAAEIGYGGYANLQTGLTLTAKLNSGLAMQLGANNVMAYIAPSMSGGQGVFLSLSKTFR